MVTENAEISEPFDTLTSADSLDELFRRSNAGPVVIFKHSLTCSISNAAYQEMQRVRSHVALIIIQRSRDLSIELEHRTGVRHESPQVIILHAGTAVWSASHWAIKAEAVQRALRENE